MSERTTTRRPAAGHPTTGAGALLDALEAWGVEYVFTCPGTTEVPLLDALVDHPGVRFVLTTHEAVAVSMADGYARATGRPAVAYLHTNVGLNNGLAHLYAAQLAHSPVVVLTGVKPTATLPHRALTTVPYIREFARPYVKHDWMTLRPDALLPDLHRALSLATAPPAGPTFLAIPQDVLGAEFDVDANAGPSVARPTPARAAPDPDAVAAAARALVAAERPVIVAGGEVARHRAVAALECLSEHLGAPVLAESRRDIEATAIRTDHPNYAGFYDARAPLVTGADVIFLAGTPTFLEMEPGRPPLLPSAADLVHLCEDPGELGRRYPTSVGLTGHAELALDAIGREVTALGRSGQLPRARNRPAARAAMRTHPGAAKPSQANAEPRTHTGAGTAEARMDPAGTSTVADLMDELVAAQRPEDVFVVDAVTSTEPLLNRMARTTEHAFYATTSGSLGWGMGAALGVQLGLPDRPVTCVVGDGVFQFGLPALWTAKEYDLPVRFVVVNNGAYQAVRFGLERLGGRAQQTGTYPLTSIGGVDAAQVAHGFGLPAERAESREALSAALAKAAAVGHGPSLVDAIVI